MKNFIIFSLVALTFFLPPYKAYSILINDRFGSVDKGTRLNPIGDTSKYSDFDACEIMGIKGDVINLECYRSAREPRTGKPFTFKKTFEISAREIPKYFTK
jgi:hypothetical protein